MIYKLGRYLTRRKKSTHASYLIATKRCRFALMSAMPVSLLLKLKKLQPLDMQFGAQNAKICDARQTKVEDVLCDFWPCSTLKIHGEC